jgi:sec-independent protein translocase protein TatA
MPFHLGTPELIILFLIVLLVFGAGRIARIGRELGSGLREFRHGLGTSRDEESAAGAKESQ